MDVPIKYLAHYLEQIYVFLINDESSNIFPSLTMCMEDILVNIAKDVNFLKNELFYGDCKVLADQIYEVLQKNKQIFTLSYSFDTKAFGKQVMVYKKLPVPVFKEPLGIKQLRKPHQLNSHPASSNEGPTVMSSFKISSLNATLKFVKNDQQFVLQYPDMSTEQAEFVKQMITQCLARTDGSASGPGSQGMYDPLAEALRIFSLKYDFKLNHAVPVHVDMKRLFFEKIPKKTQMEDDIVDVDNYLSSDSNDSGIENHHNFIQQINRLDKIFIHNAITQIRDFLQDEEKDRIVFPLMTIPQEQFLMKWKSVLITPNVMAFFEKSVRSVLCEISEIMTEGRSLYRIRTTMQIVSPTHRNVHLRRRWLKRMREQRAMLKLNAENKTATPTLTPSRKVTENGEIVNTKKTTPNTMYNTPIVKVKMEKNITTAKTANMTGTMSGNVTELNNNKTCDSTILKPSVNIKTETLGMDGNETLHSVENASILNATVNALPEKVKTKTVKELLDFIKKRDKNPIVPDSPKKSDKKINAIQTCIAAVPGEFTENAFTRLRDFVLSNEETLHYSGLSREELDILFNWDFIMNRNKTVSMFSVKGQMILDEIRSHVESSRGIFRVTTKTETTPTDRNITFTKTYLKKKEPKIKTEAFPDASDDPVSISDNLTIKIQSENEKVRNFIEKTIHISKTWIKTVLNQLKEFIKDEAQASLLISDVPSDRLRFLTRWKKIIAKKSVIEIYPMDIQIIFNEIRSLVADNEKSFKVVCDVSSGKKKDLLQDVTFTKIPNFDGVAKDVPAKIKTESPAKTKTVSAKSVSPAKKKIVSTKTESPAKTKTNTAPTSTSKDKGIPKSSSGSSLLATKPKVPDRPRPKSANLNMPSKAKAKLMEGLSQPVVSEKGLKMMRNMGWDGGALGVRGEGIVEPIALPLDLGKRAGLGSEKTQQSISTKLAQKSVITNLPINITQVVLPRMPGKLELKTGILQLVLNLVQMALPAVELSLPDKLTLKHWNFIKNVVLGFNRRGKVFPTVSALNDLYKEILDILVHTEYVITACWGVSKLNVLFVLSKSVCHGTDIDTNDWCSIANFDKPTKADLQTPLPQPPKCVPKSPRGEPFRHYLLAQILEFCERPNITIDKKADTSALSKEIRLKDIIEPKQQSYIKDLIARLNNKSRSSSDSKIEINMFNDIKEKMTGFTLDVDYPQSKGDNTNEAIHDTIRFYKILDIKETSKFSKTVQNEEKDIENRKHLVAKRRTTFTNDKFDEKCMFDNHNAPMYGQDAPTICQNAPMQNQDAQINCQNAPLNGLSASVISQNAPMVDQNTPMGSQSALLNNLSAPIISQNSLMARVRAPSVGQDAPTDSLSKVNDCICCFDDDEVSKESEHDVIESVEVNKESEHGVNESVEVNRESEHGVNESVEVNKESEHGVNESVEVNKESEHGVNESVEVNKESEYGVNESVEVNKESEHGVNESVEYIFIQTETSESIKDSHRPELAEENDIENLKNESTKDLGKRLLVYTPPHRANKKCRYEESEKIIKITPKNNPLLKITPQMVIEIQKSILESIDYTDELPLLGCHGIQDGALLYSCHNEKSVIFMNKVTASLGYQASVIQESDSKRHRMTIRINSYICETVILIIDRLKIFNPSLNTKDWKVLDMFRESDTVVISVEIDDESFRFIAKQGYSLYSGTDIARFSVLWD